MAGAPRRATLKSSSPLQVTQQSPPQSVSCELFPPKEGRKGLWSSLEAWPPELRYPGNPGLCGHLPAGGSERPRKPRCIPGETLQLPSRWRGSGSPPRWCFSASISMRLLPVLKPVSPCSLYPLTPLVKVSLWPVWPCLSHVVFTWWPPLEGQAAGTRRWPSFLYLALSRGS